MTEGEEVTQHKSARRYRVLRLVRARSSLMVSTSSYCTKAKVLQSRTQQKKASRF